MVPDERLRVTVVTATGLEYSQARKVLGDRVALVRAGIAMRRNGHFIEGTAISCGLAGGLRPDLPTGTILIPSRIGCEDGSFVACDETMTRNLRAAAARLRLRVDRSDLLTTAALVHGERRVAYASAGFGGVDMESGLLDAQRIACVRVVLDTPEREISPAWVNGVRAAVTPSAWRDLPFLMKNGPRCARTAAEVIAEALR
ncbi:MAG TPA: hypothetical protein VFL13_13630 [Candidatus Baltobacteraceae bacterium]|nr:hypothetical protein [Candidatus Baltobacteraceae bacterium]